MTRVINSIESMEQYLNLLTYTEEQTGSIPETMINDFKKALHSTTYGMRLRSLVVVKDRLPKYYEHFINE